MRRREYEKDLGDFADKKNRVIGIAKGYELGRGYDGGLAVGKSGDTYAYYANGGWSWTVSYIAGMYVLCAQVELEIMPEKFYALAWKTSTEIERESPVDRSMHTFHVLNPQARIESLQESKAAFLQE